MKRITTKKLVLDTRTIRTLNARELAAAVGGQDAISKDCSGSTCVAATSTSCNCPTY